jgi:ubiquinone/menaquinone biosynthesis C-methylase UbiE
MAEKMHWTENLTNDEKKADLMWDVFSRHIEEAGRNDILKNPTVLDLGGGRGEFSKFLNANGIKCVSLEIKNLETNPGANQVRADAYHIPFADKSFDMIYGMGSLDTFLYPHDFSKLLPEIARVLKDKGIFYTWDNKELNKEEVEKYFKRLLRERIEDFVGMWEKI